MLLHKITDYLLVGAAVVVLAGLGALIALVRVRFRSVTTCRCPRCGRHERMKPFCQESLVRLRISYLLYCGLLPGFLYTMWVSRLHLCPHCLNVASAAELEGRQVSRLHRRKRRRRSSPEETDGTAGLTG